MLTKGNPYEGMTVNDFKHLLPKSEREEFERYIAERIMEKYEVEA